eukprot:scaffold315342_cov27-Tisochrysis_lutea.AAC.1
MCSPETRKSLRVRVQSGRRPTVILRSGPSSRSGSASPVGPHQKSAAQPSSSTPDIGRESERERRIGDRERRGGRERERG